MNTTTLPAKNKHLESVETEYDKYCNARRIFMSLRPNWLVFIISTFIAIGLIGYGLGVASQSMVIALACVSASLVFMIGVVVLEHRRIHRRMEALAEMRLRGKTFNF